MKRKNNCIILCILALMLSSCSREELTDQPDVHAGNISIRLSLSQTVTSRTETETGEDELNENRIRTLDVFMYREEQETCAFYQRISLSPEQMESREYTVTLGTAQEGFAQNAMYTTYVVGNYSGSIPEGGLTRSSLKALQVTALNPDKTQDSFSMDGVSEDILNDGNVGNKEIAVALKRAVAKIRVSTVYANGFSTLAGETIRKKLFQYVTNASLLESGNPVTPERQNMPAFTPVTAGADRIVVYSYPHDWSLQKQYETYMIVNIPVITSNGAAHTQNYYKIAVNPYLPTNEIYRLERNHLYDITVRVDQLGSSTPETAVKINANYAIKDWTTHEVLVSVEGFNFIYVRHTNIKLPNNTQFSTTFQSSTPDVSISDMLINGKPVTNGSEGVSITCSQGVKTGTITINSTLPGNFVAKEISFTVKNGAGLTQQVSVLQYPPLYIDADISADDPGGSQGQNNKKMFIIGSFVADFSTLPDPDEFSEMFGSGYTHYAPDPVLGKSYAEYIRKNAVLGYPLTDNNGLTINTEENNRRISPRFMLASQYGITSADSYLNSRNKCLVYVEQDSTTNETYSDWRMPTLAEVYLIDVLQNIKVAEVKKILEGHWYWSARSGSSVQFMDPRVGNSPTYNSLNAAVRCVRDVKF